MDEGRRKMTEAVMQIMPSLEFPPSDEVATVALFAKASLLPLSDEITVDTCFGGGECVLDFWLDRKAIRVIVKSVPELDKEP